MKVLLLVGFWGCSQKSSKKDLDHGKYTIEKMSEPPPQYRSTDSIRPNF